MKLFLCLSYYLIKRGVKKLKSSTDIFVNKYTTALLLSFTKKNFGSFLRILVFWLICSIVSYKSIMVNTKMRRFKELYLNYLLRIFY